jgi:hypothetical protein
MNSPTCCIVQASQKTCLEGRAVRSLARKQRVRFSIKPSQEIASELSEHEVARLWLSPEEHNEIKLQAELETMHIRKQSPEYCDAILALFQDSLKQYDFEQLWVTKNVQTILHFEIPNHQRGLERHLHSKVSRYRVFHVQSLLAVQEKFKSTSSESRQQKILRSKSLHTSQASGAIARIFGNRDAIHAANAIREEICYTHGKCNPRRNKLGKLINRLFRE